MRLAVSSRIGRTVLLQRPARSLSSVVSDPMNLQPPPSSASASPSPSPPPSSSPSVAAAVAAAADINLEAYMPAPMPWKSTLSEIMRSMILFEDEHLLVVYKPAMLLSLPPKVQYQQEGMTTADLGASKTPALHNWMPAFQERYTPKSRTSESAAVRVPSTTLAEQTETENSVGGVVHGIVSSDREASQTPNQVSNTQTTAVDVTATSQSATSAAAATTEPEPGTAATEASPVSPMPESVTYTPGQLRAMHSTIYMFRFERFVLKFLKQRDGVETQLFPIYRLEVCESGIELYAKSLPIANHLHWQSQQLKLRRHHIGIFNEKITDRLVALETLMARTSANRVVEEQHETHEHNLSFFHLLTNNLLRNDNHTTKTLAYIDQRTFGRVTYRSEFQKRGWSLDTHLLGDRPVHQLHCNEIEFLHPLTLKKIIITCDVPRIWYTMYPNLRYYLDKKACIRDWLTPPEQGKKKIANAKKEASAVLLGGTE